MLLWYSAVTLLRQYLEVTHMKVLQTATLEYTDRSGETKTAEFKTGFFGKMKAHDGGSFYLCTGTVLLEFGTDILKLDGVVARVTAGKGEFVLESKYKSADYFVDGDPDAHPGARSFDWIGVGREKFVKLVLAACPELRERRKTCIAQWKKNQAARNAA
jgi:hypothetical protein